MSRKTLKVNEPLKYPQHGKRDPSKEEIDNLPNFFHLTHTQDEKTQAHLESGFNPMASLKPLEVKRRPAILIRSSPRRAGSNATPWHDTYDMDGGRVRYFGDAKLLHMPDPLKPKGNKAMQQVVEEHRSPDIEIRKKACPLLFFVSPESGIVEFRGIGIVERVELVTQVDPESGLAFSNYVYDCALLSMAEEGEEFDWEWISKRKDPSISHNESLTYAPESWRTWVEEGPSSLNKIRRVTSRLGIVKKSDQLPKSGSPEEKTLQEIYDFYSSRGNTNKGRFEAVAEKVAAEVISESGSIYIPGWLTKRSGDGGVDFVGRLDVGSGFSSTSQVVLGQAKCEIPDGATSGKDIARTVARLRRGWIGCYVTTSFFSEPVQKEIIEDRYPLITIPGLKVAEIVRKLCLRDGISTKEFLEQTDQKYESRLANREPEQILVT